MAGYEEIKGFAEAAIGRVEDPIDQDILRRRFGLEDGQSQTIEEVAKALELPFENVQEREVAALEEMREKQPPMPEGEEGSATFLLRQALNKTTPE